MNVMVDFAKEELRRLRSGKPDEMQDMIEAHIIKMVELFSDEGHSGSSAPYCIGILEKVLRFEPVTPLTGDADEWMSLDYAGDMEAQNKRCPHVFRRADGTAYDIEGIIWRDLDGSYFTNSDSRVDITFPYTPVREYRDRPT